MNWAPLAVTVLKSWLWDAPLGHLPAAHSDKILRLISWIPLKGHPNMGTDRTWREKLPKLQCRHGHGPHTTALSPSTTEASPHHSDRKVMYIFGTLKHHPGTLSSISINTPQISMTLWGTSCEHNPLPVTLYFIKATESGLKTLFMLLNVASKHLVLARNALYKQLSSLHIVTLWTFSVFLFIFLWSAIYITDSGISSGKLRTHRSHRFNVSLLRKRMEEKLPKN